MSDTLERAPDRAPSLPATSPRRSEWTWRAAAALLHVALFTVVAYRGIFRFDEWVGPNLLHKHTALVHYAFEDVWRPFTPGYLFRFASQSLNNVLRLPDPRIGALVTCALAYGVFGAALYETFRRTNLGTRLLSRRAALAASVVLALLESPSALWGWTDFDGDRFFLPMYLPFVPTTLAALGLNLFLMLAVAALVSGRLPEHRSRWLPLLVLAAGVAKPTLLPVLAFSAFVVTAWDDRARRRALPDEPGRLGQVVRHFVLPAGALLSIQLYTTIYKLKYEEAGYDDTGGWAILPFEELRAMNALTPLFFGLVLFPLVTLVIFRRRLLSDRSVLLVVVAIVPALAMALLLYRTGQYQGDMLHPLEASVSTAVILIARRLLELRRDGQMSRFEGLASLAALAPYVLAGLTSYACHIGAGCPAL